MAYCRFSQGDVYLVKTPHPDTEAWECMACRLDPHEGHEHFYSLMDVIEHLEEHNNRGHLVSLQAWERVESELVEMFKKYPTPENIDAAMQVFFADTYVSIGDLDFFFLCPSNDWEDQFLSTLESLNFEEIWKERRRYFIFLQFADRFRDKDRALRVLKSWKREIIRLVKTSDTDPRPVQEELSDADRAEKRLLEAIFWEGPEPREALHEMRRAIRKMSMKMKHTIQEMKLYSSG